MKEEKKVTDLNIVEKEQDITGKSNAPAEETQKTAENVIDNQDVTTEEKEQKKAKKSKDKKAKKEKAPVDKAKKKKIRRRVIWGVIAAVVVLLLVVNSIAKKNVGIPVETVDATVETIQQSIATSGKVTSENVKTYFSPVTLKVGNVNVAAGDVVKKGDVLLTFDDKELADAKQTAQLKLQASDGSYASTLYKENKYIAELGEANVNLGVLEQQIADSENYVKELEKKIEDKKTSLAYEGTLLQISLIEWSDNPMAEEYENLQKLIQRNAYEQSNNSEIRAWQREISEYQEKIAAYKEYRAEMKSQKASSEGGALDEGGKSQMEANAQIEKMNNEDLVGALTSVENGIVAEFDGVVTSVDIVEGATVSEGAKLFTVESLESVKVDISISKYDLDKIALDQSATIVIAGNKYDGKVSKINGMATPNSNGTAVIGASIEVENPDNGIYLGVEARVEVSTAEISGVVTVPIEAVNTNKDGDFLYVVKDGQATKVNIVAGISSDTRMEVKEGLSAGDVVIVSSLVDLEEGMKVTAIPQE